MDERNKKFLIIGLVLLGLVGFYFLARNVSVDWLKEIGGELPLPVFTFLIGLLDGFNPCTLFVLTVFLGLVISVSQERKRILIVGLVFVGFVFLVYFLFMAAWLNVFKFIGFIEPLRIGVALVAIIAGLINCKEFFFFRKWVTLMIQEKHKILLLRKIEKMKGLITTGSMGALILASVALAAFTSLVEIPCTAGFPLIYTAILAGKMGSGWGYYGYLLFYNLMYVVPISIVVLVMGWTFKAGQISQKQMRWIKLAGGLVMILLGIILLANPGVLVG